MNSENPTLSNDRYRVLRCIGKGGMAAVFLAYDTVLKVDRAIKVLRPEYMVKASIRQRFATEAIAMAQISHPNVVQVFDHGIEGMTSYIVMAYLPHGSLFSYLSQHGLLRRQQALTICMEIAFALKQAHGLGIIHRDIKPDNILLSPDGAKLTDFGLARLADTSLRHTQTQAVMGTFPFMAPEQRLSAKKTNHQADIYALSATLFSMLSKKDPTELYDPEAQISLLVDFDGDLVEIITRGCHMNCSLRYSVVDEMIEDLTRALASGPVPEALNLSDHDSLPPVDLVELKKTWQIYTSSTLGDDVSSETVFVESGSTGNATTIIPSMLEESLLDAPVSVIEPPPESSRSSKNNHLLLFFGGVSFLLSLGLFFSFDDNGSSLEANSITVPVNENDAFFRLFQPIKDSDELGFQKVIAALLAGELSQAERLLGPFTESYPNEPAVHSIASIIYAFQGKEMASAEASNRAFYLSGDSSQPLAQVIRLADRSWRDSTQFSAILSSWSTLKTTHSDPMIDLIYLVGVRFYHQPDILLGEVALAEKKHPNTPIFSYFDVVYHQMVNRGEGTLERIEDAIQAYPGTMIFQLERGKELYRIGRLDAAEEVFKSVLRQDANIVQARIYLAGIYTRKDLEKERFEQFSLALSDVNPLSEQLMFLEHHGSQFANIGQLREADKVWRFCVTLGLEDGLQLQSTQCMSRAINAYLMLGEEDLAQWSEWVSELEAELVKPGMNQNIRRLWSVMLQYAKGLAAVRSGDLVSARTYLDMIRALDPETSAFNRDLYFASALHFEIMLAEEVTGESESYQELVGAMADFTSGGCLERYRLSRAADKLNQQAEVGRLLTTILDNECSGRFVNQGMILGLSQVWQASRFHASGDTESAKNILTQFQVDWSTPDPDLKIVQSAVELSTLLSDGED